jgi:phosphoglycolate phosphatase-like HAD superfamily hydrolase
MVARVPPLRHHRPMWRIHRGIGVGGDTFVPEIGGHDVEQAHGEDLRQAWVEEFDQLIAEVQPFEGAHELLAEVKQRGFRLVWPAPGKPSTSRRSST